MAGLVKSPFAIIPWEVAADKRLTSRHLRVLIALLSFRSQDTGPFWATREQIQERSGLPLTRISAVTTELETLGWLRKEGRGHAATRYFFSVPTVTNPVTVTEMVTVAKPVTVTVTKSVTQQSPTGVTLLDPTETLSETHKAFEAFWALCPPKMKKGRGAAIKAWFKLKPDSIPLVMQALQSQIDERSRAEPGAFVPHWKHASSWLNKECWLDAPEEYKAPKGKLSVVERVEIATRQRKIEREALEGESVKLIP